MDSGIYLITCTGNSKQYVGSSNNIPYRWRKHREKLASGRHWNRFLQRSWNKYGAEAFEYAVLEVVDDPAQLRIREQHWIDTLHPEFNLSPFANRPTTTGFTYSEESRERMSAAQRAAWARLTDEERTARYATLSHPHTEETKQLLSERTKQAHADGKLNTEEARAKLRAVQGRRWATHRVKKAAERIEWEAGREQREQARRGKLRIANTGKRLTEEQKAKVRAAATEQWNDPEYRAKHQAAVREAMQRPDVLQRLSDSHKGYVPTAEHRENIGKAHRGKKVLAETGAKISAAKLGKKHSPETIEKLKKAQQARWARARAAKEEQRE